MPNGNDSIEDVRDGLLTLFTTKDFTHRYNLPQVGTVEIERGSGWIEIRVGSPRFEILPRMKLQAHHRNVILISCLCPESREHEEVAVRLIGAINAAFAQMRKLVV